MPPEHQRGVGQGEAADACGAAPGHGHQQQGEVDHEAPEGVERHRRRGRRGVDPQSLEEPHAEREAAGVGRGDERDEAGRHLGPQRRHVGHRLGHGPVERHRGEDVGQLAEPTMIHGAQAQLAVAKASAVLRRSASWGSIEVEGQVRATTVTTVRGSDPLDAGRAPGPRCRTAAAGAARRSSSSSDRVAQGAAGGAGQGQRLQQGVRGRGRLGPEGVDRGVHCAGRGRRPGRSPRAVGRCRAPAPGAWPPTGTPGSPSATPRRGRRPSPVARVSPRWAIPAACSRATWVQTSCSRRSVSSASEAGVPSIWCSRMPIDSSSVASTPTMSGTRAALRPAISMARASCSTRWRIVLNGGSTSSARRRSDCHMCVRASADLSCAVRSPRRRSSPSCRETT